MRIPGRWEGRLANGIVYAGTLPARAGDGFGRSARRRMQKDDAIVLLEEHEAAAPGPTGALPIALASGDFTEPDAGNDDSEGHRIVRQRFSAVGRNFFLWVEVGDTRIAPDLLAELYGALGSLEIAPGDHDPDTVPPAEFAPARGWFAGSSGPGRADAEGAQTVAWTSTVPYADAPREIPDRTLAALERDDIAIRAVLSRNSRSPADGDPLFPPKRPPLTLDDASVGDVPGAASDRVRLYTVFASIRGEYGVQIQAFFGRREPTAAMLADAERALARLRLPSWPARHCTP